MENKITFRLKSITENKPTSVRMIIYHKDFKSGGRLVYGTVEKISPNYFDSESGRITKNKLLLSGLSMEEQTTFSLINKNLSDIESAAKIIMNNFQFNNKQMNADEFKLLLDEKLNRVNLKKNKNDPEVSPIENSIHLYDYLEKYIQQIKNAQRLTANGKVFSHGSLKNYLTYQSIWNLFQKDNRREINFKDVTHECYTRFVNFMTAKKYSPNTIGKHVTRLKKIMRSAEEEGLHQNPAYRKFKVFNENTEHIYLSDDEVNALLKLKLDNKKSQELCRDVFLIGCYTAQRVSDYKNIKPENITTTSRGIRILKLIQKKTEEVVLIPINSQLEVLLKKYNYRPPVVQEQKLNETIKDLGKEAGITELVEIEETRGGIKARRTVPKYELIKSHTARRTGITNMYLAEIPPIDIMKISGHKKESNFLKYIRLTKDETANRLSQNAFFK